MSTHNIGFYEDLTKIILNYHQINTLCLLLKDTSEPSFPENFSQQRRRPASTSTHCLIGFFVERNLESFLGSIILRVFIPEIQATGLSVQPLAQ